MSAGVIIGVGKIVVVDLKGLRSGFIGELFTVAPDCPAISNSGMVVNISVNNSGGLTLGASYKFRRPCCFRLGSYL